MSHAQEDRLVNNLIEAKKIAKELYPYDWRLRIQPFKEKIKVKMQADAIDEILAAARIGKNLKGHDGILCLAAAVDMIEPE